MDYWEEVMYEEYVKMTDEEREVREFCEWHGCEGVE